jgi:hypothetical protein
MAKNWEETALMAPQSRRNSSVNRGARITTCRPSHYDQNTSGVNRKRAAVVSSFKVKCLINVFI